MLNDVKIRTKLVTSYLIIGIIAAAIGLFGNAKIHQLDNKDTFLYEKTTLPLAYLINIAQGFERSAANISYVGFEKKTNHLQSVEDALHHAAKPLDDYKQTLIDAEDEKNYRELLRQWALWLTYIEKMKGLATAGKYDEMIAINAVEGAALRKDVRAVIDRVSDLNIKAARDTSDSNTAFANHTSLTVDIVIAIGVLLAISIGLLITRMITAPLATAVSVADRLAAGDLTVVVTVTGSDETSQLMAAMSHMVENLRGMISRTVDISAGIASASNQLRATSEQIATGAEEVAAQAGTVATASEEMAATSSDIARNCTMAADASHQSTDAATIGAGVVQETISGMAIIAERVRQTSQTIEALGSRSEQIGAIIGTIEDIADQTNLLALNAAIEAARAGEQGRGFAVVADEVRALAERTTNATREIGEMIKAIQDETRAAVRAMEEGVHEVQKGAVTSQKSGQALEDILQRINEVSIQVSQIATAAEEQTATTSEVTTNVQQITDVVHQTARGAEETAAAAAQLADQAQELQSLVQQFKL